MTEREVLTPSRLNALARALLEDAFPLVWIEGELSNVTRAASGHVYFALKDASAQVRCAMFRQRATYLRFRPVDGLHVLARARVGLYEARGEFQLVVEHLEEAGEGALRRAFEALKRKLHAEGLFDQARKRPLPRFVRRLAVITSPTGAAVRDVVSVLSRRWPLLEVEVLPALVQGMEAPAAIRAMLERAGASDRYDAVLLTRGGGSAEDLHAFNDEALARAIAACPVPVVSAVGHDVDFTIADFVADLRAPTPSAAAELLTPDREDLAHRIDLAKRRATRAIERALHASAQSVDLLAARLRAGHPSARLARMRAALDGHGARLHRALERRLVAARQRVALLGGRLDQRNPARAIALRRQQVESLRRALDLAAAGRLRADRDRLAGLARTLNAVSPLATLDRGYAIVADAATGLAIRHAADVAPRRPVRVRFADGEVPGVLEPGASAP
jgi:exodeoxyribonuclease VII large subunit